MLRRFLSLVILAWALGFVAFAMFLPQPAGEQRSDAAVVLTGGKGRVDRGLEALRNGWVDRVFISGVGSTVKPHEFAVEYKVSSARMACCVTLGYQAVDTRSNAIETADWIRRNDIRSIRLITSDWHMRRAAAELRSTLPPGVALLTDAVPTQPSMRILFKEYHKLLASQIAYPVSK